MRGTLSFTWVALGAAVLTQTLGCASPAASNARKAPKTCSTAADCASPGANSACVAGSCTLPPAVTQGTPQCSLAPTIHGDIHVEWVRSFGSQSQGGGLTVDADGNAFVSGSVVSDLKLGSVTITGSSGFDTPFVTKLDPSGNAQWGHVDAGIAISADVALTPDGGVYVAVQGGPSNVVTIEKLDASGSLVWQADGASTGGVQAPVSLSADASGNVAVVGAPGPAGKPGFGANSGPTTAIAVFDKTGKNVYATTFPVDPFSASIGYDGAGQLHLISSFSGSITLGAIALSSPAGNSLVRMKLSPQGNVIEAHAYAGYVNSATAAVGKDGSEITAGLFESVLDVGLGPWNSNGFGGAFVAAFDGGGSPTSGTPLIGSGISTVNRVTLDSNKNAYAIGSLSGFVDFGGGPLEGSRALFMASLGPDGKHRFSAQFGDQNTSVDAIQIATDSNGDVWITGTAQSEFPNLPPTVDLGTEVLTIESSTPYTAQTGIFVAKLAPGAQAEVHVPCSVPTPEANPGNDAGAPETTAPGSVQIVKSSDLLFAPSLDLAVDASNVYFVSDALWSAPIAGGPPVPLSFGYGSDEYERAPVSLSVVGGKLFWSNRGTRPDAVPEGPGNDGSILTMPTIGGTPKLLATGLDAPTSLVVDGSNAYFTSLGSLVSPTGDLRQVGVDGSNPTTLLAGLNQPGPLALRGTTLLFAETSTVANHYDVVRTSTTGAPPVVVTTTDRPPAAIAFDDTTVYWTVSNTEGVDTSTDNGVLMSAPLAGGAPLQLEGSLPGPGTIALDSGSVYFALGGSFGISGSVSDGAVATRAISGGASTFIVNDRRSVSTFALAPDRVFWTDEAGIFSIPK